MPVVRLRFDEEDGEQLAGQELEIVVQQWQSPALREEVTICFPSPSDIDTLTESAARGIGEALIKAADHVRTIGEAEASVRTS
jgi:hypothetical protein